jgi:hypothetical protein
MASIFIHTAARVSFITNITQIPISVQMFLIEVGGTIHPHPLHLAMMKSQVFGEVPISCRLHPHHQELIAKSFSNRMHPRELMSMV